MVQNGRSAPNKAFANFIINIKGDIISLEQADSLSPKYQITMYGRYPGSRFLEHLPEIISGMKFPKNIRSADKAYSCGYSVSISPTSLFICDAKPYHRANLQKLARLLMTQP